MAVLNWAARSRDEHGRLLLDRNPLKGLRKPVEKNPVRVVVRDKEYQALLKVSRRVGWRFHVALVLAHETGHRIGAIRNLRWADIDLDRETIRWRSEHEKTGYEHRTPLSARALAVLQQAWRRSPGIGDAPVLPSATRPLKCESPSQPRVWWCRAEQLAGMERKHRRGWHSLRRKFASDLMDQPLNSALRALRLEERQDGAQLLPAAGRGTASEGSGSPPRGTAQLNLTWRESNSGNSTAKSLAFPLKQCVVEQYSAFKAPCRPGALPLSVRARIDEERSQASSQTNVAPACHILANPRQGSSSQLTRAGLKRFN